MREACTPHIKHLGRDNPTKDFIDLGLHPLNCVVKMNSARDVLGGPLKIRRSFMNLVISLDMPSQSIVTYCDTAVSGTNLKRHFCQLLSSTEQRTLYRYSQNRAVGIR